MRGSREEGRGGGHLVRLTGRADYDASRQGTRPVLFSLARCICVLHNTSYCSRQNAPAHSCILKGRAAEKGPLLTALEVLSEEGGQTLR